MQRRGAIFTPILLRAITVSEFNQLSSHLSTFWSKIVCKRVSQYHLKWSFVSLTKTWRKDQTFSGLLWALSAHIGIDSETWNFWIRIDLCGSILQAVQLLRIAPCTGPSSGAKYVTPTVGLSSDLVQTPQHSAVQGCSFPGMWIVMHMIRFTLKVFHHVSSILIYGIRYTVYGIIFMTMTTRSSFLLTKAKQVVTLSELI